MLYGGFYLIKQVLRTNKPEVSTKREDIKGGATSPKTNKIFERCEL